MPRSLNCLVTPHGALRLAAEEAEVAVDDAVAARLEAAFARGEGHGLLQLGLAEAGSPLSPELAYWRAFAMRFVAAVCGAGENTVGAPPVDELARLADEAPPMRGGEYLDAG